MEKRSVIKRVKEEIEFLKGYWGIIIIASLVGTCGGVVMFLLLRSYIK